MTKKSSKEPAADKKPVADKAPPETPDTPEMPKTPDTSDTPTELEKAQQESEENRNLYLHAVADLENYRNRIKKDMANAVQSVLGVFCLAICDVRDCMEAALASSKTDEAKIKEGVELTLRKMESAMEMQGILPVRPDIGITFDPQLHEAVSTQAKADLAPNAIVEVVRVGYTLNGRVLRAASVIVSKKTEASDNNNNNSKGE